MKKYKDTKQEMCFKHRMSKFCFAVVFFFLSKANHAQEIPADQDEYIYINETQSFYKFQTERTNWKDAVRKCAKEGAELFYPINKCEVDKVVIHWKDTPAYGWAFIGISKLNKTDFETTDGRTIRDVYNNWRIGEPNNENGIENCVVILRDGTLIDVRCDKPFPYICKKRKKSSEGQALCDQSKKSEDPVTFRNDYVFLNDTKSLYKFHTISQKWQNAKDICSQEGAFLFYPKNKCESEVIAEFWNQTQKLGRIFVGISASANGLFETIDGIPVREIYYKWSPGEPNNENGDEKCVSLTRDMRYSDVSCSIQLPFICKKIKDSDKSNAVCDITETDTKQTTSFRKDYKYQTDTQSFYKIHTIFQTWDDAKATCEREDAQFFFPENECETKTILEYWQQTQPFDLIYVGVYNPSKEVVGGFLNYDTIDGRPVWKVFNAWSRGEPNNVNGEQNCVVLTRGGTLSSDRCDQKYGFICKKVIKKDKAYCDTDATAMRFRKDYKYVDKTQSFYKLHTEYRIWRSAKQTCEGEDAYLFYPESLCEINLIFNLLTRNHPFSRFHIGLSSTKRGIFETVDGFSLGKVYYRWRPNEPRNDDELKNCLVLRSSDLTITNENCREKLPFICKKKLVPRKNNYGCDQMDDDQKVPTFRNDYKYLDETQSFYKIHTISNNFDVAKDICEKEDAFLYYPENECEYKVFLDYWHVEQPLTLFSIHVGIKKNSEGIYETIHGQQQPNYYLNWGNSTPEFPDRSCLIMTVSGVYLETGCDNAIFFCKKKLASSNKDYFCQTKAEKDQLNGTNNAGYFYLNETQSSYIFHPSNRNWQDANKLCQKEEADIFYPRSKCELEAVLNLFKNKFGWILVGISSSAEGNFVTVDRRPLADAYINWRPGEPNNENGIENCVILLQDGTLSDVNCNRTFPFICRKNTDFANSSCGQTQIDSRISEMFGEGYNFFNKTQSAYKVHTIQRSWQSAKDMCVKEGATLFYPENKCEAYVVLEFWNQTQLFRSIYVGISSPSKGLFETLTGRPTSEMRINWRPGEPNNENGKENCVAFLNDGTFVDVQCDLKFPFICKKRISLTSELAECDNPEKDLEENYDFRLDYAYIKSTRSFYKLHTILENWEEANRTCANEGTALFYAENELEAEAVVKLWRQTQTFDKVYVGIWNPTAPPVTFNFVTIDERPIDEVYNKWQIGEPNNKDGVEFCVVLTREGVLKDDRCDGKYGFICKTTIDSVITNALHGKLNTSIGDEWSFKEQYTYLEDSQSFYKFHTQLKNWQNAKQTCDSEGAALFYPENRCEANAVLRMWRQTQFFRRAFIGISSLTTGRFETIHGSPIWLVYNNWQPGEPNNANYRENCVVIYANGTLNDEQCEYRIPFICKRKSYSKNKSLCNKLQINETQFIQKDYNYIEDTQSLYKIHTIQATWYAAKKICIREGASLFYPENECEAKAVIKFWKETQPYEWLFLGISSKKTGKFETVDGRPIWKVYNKWRPSQPDNSGNSESCVVMYREDGTFNDDRCLQTASFICKKKSALIEAKADAVCDTVKTQTRITDYVQDYTYLGDIQNLYKIHTIFQSSENAVKTCLEERATIFYPESELELKTVLKFWDKTQVYKEVFVGLKLRKNKTLTTINGNADQNLQYVWKPSKMINSSGENSCILLRRDGALDEDSCSTTHPFICKKTLRTLKWNILCDTDDFNYSYSRTQKKCYKVHMTPLTWSNAFIACSDEQSHLAVINNQDEADYLVKITSEAVNAKRDNKLADVVYLGFHSQSGNGWRTVTGQSLQDSGYKKWNFDLTRNQNRCGGMSYDGTLNHLDCSTSRFFVCEHEIDDSTDDIYSRRG